MASRHLAALAAVKLSLRCNSLKASNQRSLVKGLPPESASAIARRTASLLTRPNFQQDGSKMGCNFTQFNVTSPFLVHDEILTSPVSTETMCAKILQAQSLGSWRGSYALGPIAP